MARAAMRSDMYSVLAVVTRSVLTASSDSNFKSKLDTWRVQQATGISRVRVLLEEISSRETPDIAAISVALRTLRELAQQTESASTHSN
jgi:glutamate dehydrogenase